MAFRALHKYGACFEDEWPSTSISKYRERPPSVAYASAWRPCAHGERVPQELAALKYHLANGFLIAFGTTVYASFESASTVRSGKVTLPNTTIEPHFGGHAMVLVGYDEHDDHFIVRNSWSQEWGDSGYAYLPYAYVLDSGLCNDFWVLVADMTYTPLVVCDNDTSSDDAVTTNDDTTTDEDEDEDEDDTTATKAVSYRGPPSSFPRRLTSVVEEEKEGEDEYDDYKEEEEEL
jgi:C1A family cysteine protease